jgi:hypothetical protein
MHLYRYRSQLNIEFLEIRDLFLPPKQINCLINITHSDTYNVEPDSIEEFSENIREIIESNHSETKEKIEKLEANLTLKMENYMVEIKKLIEVGNVPAPTQNQNDE